MKNISAILEALMGKKAVDALIPVLAEQLPSFREQRRNYLAALEKLNRTEEGKWAPEKLSALVEQKFGAILFFCGMQGLRMNYDHFQNPMSPNCTWKQVDFEDYLQLDRMYGIPMYSSACSALEDICNALPEECRKLYEYVDDYETALEVCGSKLAHYYGYCMGNVLLQHCVPGYRPDPMLDLRYYHMLSQYFGAPLREKDIF